MPTIELTINNALAEILSETRRLWRVKDVIRSETTEVLERSGKRPDILVSEPNVSPVIIETEVLPAVTVEADAFLRLGEHLQPSGRRILSAVAIRMPLRLRDLSGSALRSSISDASDFEMALYTGENATTYSRWPQAGWLLGSVVDLSILVQLASVPPAVIDEAANVLVNGVREAAALLNEVASAHPGAMPVICTELRQQDGEQTRRMAMTIVANAFVFHESLARGPGELGEVRTLDELRGMSGGLSKSAVLSEWRKILDVNYWPIFDIARRILEVIPSDNVGSLIQHLAATAGQLTESRLMRSHDLTGAVFQRLIADRKFLAAYYTHPASAALLVGLAIRPDTTPAGGSWEDPVNLSALRIADFACGTGTLLSTAYRRVSSLHEAAGGDAEALHSSMMAESLVGCDVLPAAAHLTASMLAGAHPTVKYSQSSVMTVAYGIGDEGRVALGSLDLLDQPGTLEVLPITAQAVEGMSQTERAVRRTLPHATFDLVVMNPPFTRDTGHEGAKIGVPNPMFAAFGLTADQQRAMARVTERLLKGSSAHGNAGEASAFLVLADRKLKLWGTLALVMPLSLMSGEAWEKSRQLLHQSYGGLIVVSIAGARHDAFSFSADTGMGECLVVGHKTGAKSDRATFVILNKRPDSQIIGASVAEQVHRAIASKPRRLEDGPVGGTPIRFGNDVIGFIIDAPLPESGPWNLVRMADVALGQVAYQLKDHSLIWLPGMVKSAAAKVPVATIGRIGRVGPYHMDVNGNTPTGGIRGPFRIESLDADAAPTYPVLWSHEAGRERCMEFEADSEGVIRQGVNPAEDPAVRSKADRIWSTASHCHFNRDFQFNSQSTAMQFTVRKAIGWRAWPSISLNNADEEKALTLWANSSFGLLLHWWHANKQQAGRGSIGVSSLESLPVLDVTKLSPKALLNAVAIFEDLKHRKLRPVNEIGHDALRREIDDRIATEVLGLSPELTSSDGPLALLRQKLALEPSITGGKSA